MDNNIIAQIVTGRTCDFGQIDDSGHAELMIINGPHAGHAATYSGWKSNGGEGGETVTCSACSEVIGGFAPHPDHGYTVSFGEEVLFLPAPDES